MSTQADSIEEQLQAVTVTHPPARLSSALAITCGLLAVLASAPATILALGIGVFGLGGLAVAQFVVQSRRLAGAGVAVIFLAVVLAGVLGNDAVLVVVATLATILAFDLSQNGFSVGDQLSGQTSTYRGEVVHAVASLFVGVVATIVVFAIYLVFGGEQTPAALVFLLFAAVVLVWTIRS